jgi:RNA 2',3'-cyclic 3'-phosphodiesterase
LRLRSGCQDYVKWVGPLNIHLTLKFLGNVGEDSISKIVEVMGQASCYVAPFHLEIKGIGAFPNLSRVRIVWVGLAGELSVLADLQKKLDSGLEGLGFVAENRPFVPHLTLGRMREGVSLQQRQAVGKFIAEANFESTYRVDVEDFLLMKSQLGRGAPVYSRIASVRLKGTC